MPPPPPGTGGFGAPGLPAKPNMKPPKPTVGLNWSKLPNKAAMKTRFKDLKEADGIAMLDLDDLLSEFGKEAAKTKAVAPKRVSAPSFLDAKRSNNVGIIRSRVKIADADLVKAIYANDRASLTDDVLGMLEKIVPTVEEDVAIDAFLGDPLEQGTAERFHLEIHNVTRVRERLDLMLYSQRHAEAAGQLEEDSSALINACRALNSSERFKSLLELVINVGNYMNGGTTRGGAYGFKLSALTKLADVKQSEGKGTLLDYIAELCLRKYPDIALFPEDLEDVPSAAKVEVRQASAALNALKKDLKNAEHKIKLLDGVESVDDLLAGVTPFVSDATKQIETLTSDIATLVQLQKETLAKFGEDPKGQKKLEELLQGVAAFMSLWTLAAKAAAAKIDGEAEGGTKAATPVKKKTTSKPDRGLMDEMSSNAKEGMFRSKRDSARPPAAARPPPAAPAAKAEQPAAANAPPAIPAASSKGGPSAVPPRLPPRKSANASAVPADVAVPAAPPAAAEPSAAAETEASSVDDLQAEIAALQKRRQVRAEKRAARQNKATGI